MSSASDLLITWQIVSSTVEDLHREVIDMVRISPKKTPGTFIRRVVKFSIAGLRTRGLLS